MKAVAIAITAASAIVVIRILFISLAVLLAGYYVLFEYTFERDIQQTVEATVYVDGEAADTTTVTIDGRQVYSLLSPYRTELLNFYGTFQVKAVPQTCRAGVQMHIYGEEDSSVQCIRGYYAGDFMVPFNGVLLISFDMTEFAMWASETTVIATSEDLYHQWIELDVFRPHGAS